MPSNDDLQSLLAKYRVAPQIQATLENALSKANDKTDRQAPCINATEHVSTKSTEFQLPVKHNISPTSKISSTSPISIQNEEKPSIHPNPTGVDNFTKYERSHENREMQIVNVQKILSEPPKDQQPTEKNVKISETIKHYKEEPQRYLGTHSVETQTPLVLTEENEVLRRLQGEIDHVKSQLSCLQVEIIKQFINLDDKITALSCQCKQ